jgi:hypothetical protein
MGEPRRHPGNQGRFKLSIGFFHNVSRSSRFGFGRKLSHCFANIPTTLARAPLRQAVRKATDQLGSSTTAPKAWNDHSRSGV